jgi:hypothetical protein
MKDSADDKRRNNSLDESDDPGTKKWRPTLDQWWASDKRREYDPKIGESDKHI